jgi:uncharacterized membrane protein
METSIEQGSRTTGSNGGRNGGVAHAAAPRPAIKRTYQQIADSDRGTGGESLSNFLGWFSIGLGLAEALAPGALTRVVGVEPNEKNRNVMRAMGVREIGHGLAILTNQQPTKAMWARVAGDALDLALLGKAMANPDNGRGRTMFATANVLAVTALDIIAARELSRQPSTEATAIMDKGLIRRKAGVTVNRSVEEVYAYWRDFQNFPHFMRHLESVTDIGGGRSHWVAKAPAGKEVQWEAQITEDVPNQRIGWRSVEGSEVYNAGTVSFQKAPGDRGTEVRVELEYDPPFGKLGAQVAKLFREEPGQQIFDDLRHFKQVMELGEIVVSDATKQRGMHAAQPDDKPVEL